MSGSPSSNFCTVGILRYGWNYCTSHSSPGSVENLPWTRGINTYRRYTTFARSFLIAAVLLCSDDVIFWNRKRDRLTRLDFPKIGTSKQRFGRKRYKHYSDWFMLGFCVITWRFTTVKLSILINIALKKSDQLSLLIVYRLSHMTGNIAFDSLFSGNIGTVIAPDTWLSICNDEKEVFPHPPLPPSSAVMKFPFCARVWGGGAVPLPQRPVDSSQSPCCTPKII